MVNSYRNIEEGDRIRIDTQPLSDAVFRVSEKEVTDIGLTETLVVTLVSEAEEGWRITGTTGGSQVTVKRIDDDRSVQVFWKQVTVEE